MKGEAKKKLKDHDSYDHLAPTKMEDHKPITAPEKTDNLSNREVQDKLDVYSRIGNKMERYFSFQKSKEQFKAHMDKLNDNYLKQDIYLSKTRHFGLDHSNPQIIKDDRDWKDQDMRNRFMSEQKNEYDKDGLKKSFEDRHKKLGLNHNFNHAKNKDKGMDKDR